MGCSGSKSSPVIEPGIEPNKNTITSNGAITQKLEDIVDNGYGVEGTVETKPNTPDTERVVDSDEPEEAEKIVQELDVAVNKENLIVEELEDLTIPEKPLTPMPESVIMNAQWPNVTHESKEKTDAETLATSNLDPIEEEKRFVALPNEEGPAVIEILTIQVSEIPLVDDRVMEQIKSVPDEDKDKDEKEQKEDSET